MAPERPPEAASTAERSSTERAEPPGEASEVEVLGAYSNPDLQVRQLARLLEVKAVERPTTPRKQAQRRLNAADQAELVANYIAGATVYELASQFCVHRHTVSAILERHGVERRYRKLTPDQLAEARDLRTAGWSYARLADHFSVDPAAMWNVLNRRRGGDES